jgi:nucleotide-binding universal stress UspA family protein
MNSPDNAKRILVAIDGSESALHAAHWAAAEATRRGRGLTIAHAYDWPLPNYRPVVVDPEVLHASVVSTAKATLAAAVGAVTEAAPTLSVTAELVSGSAVTALLDLTRRAELLVLGSRGLGGFTSLLVGSVAVELVAYGHCPVVVVRGDQPVPGAPVVVGVDGSPVSELAVALAFDEAAARGCDLVAVHTWADTAVLFGLGGGYGQALDWTSLAEEAETLLTESLAGWHEKYPGVTVRRVVERDQPANVLLEAARGAQLLVVGSRGRGGFTGLTLGSVSQALIHHSPCPVMIARPHSSE